MSLTKSDLTAIKRLFDTSFDDSVPGIVSKAIEGVKLEIGQFSLETTKRFDTLETKVDDLHDKLDETTEMADTNRIEIAKVKRKLGLT